MPHQRVADDGHLVSLAERHIRVGPFKRVYAGPRVYHLPLQVVFGRRGVELRCGDDRAEPVGSGDGGTAERRADQKVLRKNLLQRLDLLAARRPACGEYEERNRDLRDEASRAVHGELHSGLPWIPPSGYQNGSTPNWTYCLRLPLSAEQEISCIASH